MNKRIIAILSGVVVIGAVVTWFAYQNNQQYTAPAPATPRDTTPTPVPVATKPDAVVPVGKYKDGTYTATGTYFIPEGSEQVTVTVMLKNGIIVDAQFVANTRNGDSREFQNAFAQGFKEKVIGKSIDSVSLTVVNGSSLTSKGFMDALGKIKTQARA